jgi:hypothetical protein
MEDGTRLITPDSPEIKRIIGTWDNPPQSLYPAEHVWAERREIDSPQLTLSRDAGKDLKTVNNMIEWLSHPNNWIVDNYHMIKWEGTTPYLVRRCAYIMAPTSNDRMSTAQVVLIEQARLRGRLKLIERDSSDS